MGQSKTSYGDAAVTATGVTKNFGTVAALRGVDLTVPAGSITALLGPNGAGKTTLVRIIATLTKPDQGQVTVLGYDVLAAPAQVRARIGLTGQYVGLDEWLSGRQNLILIGRLAGLDRRLARARAGELAERLGVAFAIDRAVRTYSGGMRRRLDLAASLMASPPLIVLDEPTTGLDPASRQALWEALAALQAGGTTMLLTTQYLEEADRFADRVHVMDSGQIVASGTPAQLKGRVSEQVVEVVLAAVGDADAAVLALSALLPSAAGSASSGRLTVGAADGISTLLAVAGILRDAGIGVADLRLRQPSLDEAFLALTSGSGESR